MRSRVLPALLLAVVGFAGIAVSTSSNTHDYKEGAITNGSATVPSERLSGVACVDGAAGVFSCDGLDLLSFVPDEEMITLRDPLTSCAGGAVLDAALAGGELPTDPDCYLAHTGLSDIWGWTSSETGDEYVVFGKTNGTAFYNVSNPLDPQYYGEIVTAAGQLLWQDIKVHGDHAYIGSESVGHGITIFDMTQLDDMSPAPVPFFPLAPTARWEPDAFEGADSSNHNVVINEDTGDMYLVGGNAALVIGGWCFGGLYAVDISDPTAPVHTGCFEAAENEYIHDAQCAAYVGPDLDWADRNICVTSNEDFLVWVDVTDPANMTEISRLSYDFVDYAHQGWMSEDQTIYFHGDELDELNQAEVTNTRTIVVDMTDLDAPEVAFVHEHDTVSIDHNMYTHEGFLYQANYTAGVRVFDIADTAAILDPDEPRTLTEVAWFDTYPDDDDDPVTEFNGVWSVYPYFDSGVLAVSGVGEGLYLLGDLSDFADQVAPSGIPGGGAGDDGDSAAPADGVGSSGSGGEDLAATGGGAALLAVLALGGAVVVYRRREDE